MQKRREITPALVGPFGFFFKRKGRYRTVSLNFVKRGRQGGDVGGKKKRNVGNLKKSRQPRHYMVKYGTIPRLFFGGGTFWQMSYIFRHGVFNYSQKPAR